MRKTFKYRIFPTHVQATKLNKTLDSCRWLYNHFLEERKNAWEAEKKSISRYVQVNSLPILKAGQPFLQDVFSQCLQEIAVRLDLAFRAFFRRAKAGEKPGYPRFRGKFRYDSFTYPQSGFKLLKNVVQLSKIGSIRIKLHRPVEGQIKTCTVRRNPTGKWFVSFTCDIEYVPAEQPIQPTIGIDMGLESFATLSNGEKIENPRFFRQEEDALKKAQRKLSKQEKRTKARTKARKVVVRVYERINWKRHNFAHQESRKLVNRFNTICIEDLSINNMMKDNFRCLNKSISDAAWRQFLEYLRYKAEYAGAQCIRVNPAYTSQICSVCGNRHKLELSQRIYHCPACGFSVDRDINAAINILSLGIQTLGIQPVEAPSYL